MDTRYRYRNAFNPKAKKIKIRAVEEVWWPEHAITVDDKQVNMTFDEAIEAIEKGKHLHYFKKDVANEGID